MNASVIGTISTAIFMFLVGLYAGWGARIHKGDQIKEMRLQAIENGCAQYNRTTAEFEWIKNHENHIQKIPKP